MTSKPVSDTTQPFWRKPLSEMSESEWESLCDGCGRCCLMKLEDEDTGRVVFTSLGCRLLRSSDCRCADYEQRQTRVPDCIKLTPEAVAKISWLPPTCGYRLVSEGKDLMWWHPLVSGTSETVHEAGVSVRNRVAAGEDDVELEDYADFMVAWPMRTPKRAKTQPAPSQAVKDQAPETQVIRTQVTGTQVVGTQVVGTQVIETRASEPSEAKSRKP